MASGLRSQPASAKVPPSPAAASRQIPHSPQTQLRGVRRVTSPKAQPRKRDEACGSTSRSQPSSISAPSHVEKDRPGRPQSPGRPGRPQSPALKQRRSSFSPPSRVDAAKAGARSAGMLSQSTAQRDATARAGAARPEPKAQARTSSPTLAKRLSFSAEPKHRAGTLTQGVPAGARRSIDRPKVGSKHQVQFVEKARAQEEQLRRASPEDDCSTCSEEAELTMPASERLLQEMRASLSARSGDQTAEQDIMSLLHCSIGGLPPLSEAGELSSRSQGETVEVPAAFITMFTEMWETIRNVQQQLEDDAQKLAAEMQEVRETQDPDGETQNITDDGVLADERDSQQTASPPAEKAKESPQSDDKKKSAASELTNGLMSAATTSASSSSRAAVESMDSSDLSKKQVSLLKELRQLLTTNIDTPKDPGQSEPSASSSGSISLATPTQPRPQDVQSARSPQRQRYRRLSSSASLPASLSAPSDFHTSLSFKQFSPMNVKQSSPIRRPAIVQSSGYDSAATPVPLSRPVQRISRSPKPAVVLTPSKASSGTSSTEARRRPSSFVSSPMIVPRGADPPASIVTDGQLHAKRVVQMVNVTNITNVNKYIVPASEMR